MGARKQVDLQYFDKTQAMLVQQPTFVKTYVRSIHNAVSNRTCYEYTKDIIKYFQWLSNTTGEPITIELLAAQHCEDFEEYLEYLEHYVSHNGIHRTNSRPSIKRKLASLRKFFAWLFSNGFIPADETRKVAIPKTPRKTINYMETDEIQSLLHTVSTGQNMTKRQQVYHQHQVCRDMAIVMLMLSTGIRVSECVELDTSDINLNNCSIHITRKGGEESTVYFSDETLPYLRSYMQLRMNMTDVPQTEHALFLSSRKRRCSIRTVETIIEKYSKIAISGKHITPHTLRSTFATHLYQATSDIYLVAETLGHKDITTTKDHYAHLTDTKKQANRNKLNEIINLKTQIPEQQNTL